MGPLREDNGAELIPEGQVVESANVEIALGDVANAVMGCQRHHEEARLYHDEYLEALAHPEDQV